MTDSDVDDDFEAWMNQIALNVNDGDDYQPFPSKMLALLLFPVHGVHTLLSLSRSGFVFILLYHIY